MKMFRLVAFVFVIVISMPGGFCQKLESGGYKVSVKKFVQGESAAVCGPKKPAYAGLFLVKSKDQMKGSYYLSLVYLNEKQSMLTVKNKNQVLENPMLVYNKTSSTFQYIYKEKVLKEAKVDMEKPMQEQMLVGLVLWLQVKMQLISEKK